MPTQRAYAMLVLCTIILFSCNTKKEKNKDSAIAASVVDTTSLQPESTISVVDYSNDFIANATQKFTVAPHQTTVLKANKGLKVTVNPAVLEKADGSAVDGKIEVSIIELTTSEDLFKSNAATVSNGRLLASGGSYFIGMESEGQKLQLKKGNNLQVNFPKLKDAEMELFYGNRDSSGNMNWTRAAQPLIFNTEEVDYSSYKPPYPDTAKYRPYKSKYTLYESTDSKVIFANREMPIKEMVSILQKRGVDKNIDSIYLTFDEGYYNGCFRNYYSKRFERYKLYRVISCKELEAEKDSLAKEQKVAEMRTAANNKYYNEWEKQNRENSLAGRLEKYYAPSSVTKLGWINCDRFNDEQQKTEVQLDLPITFTNPQIEYFIIYKSFNGLMNGKLNSNSKQQYVLSNLPVGQAVTVVAFTKNNGRLYQCKEDFVIAKNQSLKLDFKNISAAEMNTIFGKSVRI
ncbi:hypothetical protein [Ferruginibacter sp. SUN106]|uniref:hypothetical protein n=1 Tax=Ferruginibacter sp. SUN106 TaxID=2978348 RepID=UPI003D35F7E0